MTHDVNIPDTALWGGIGVLSSVAAWCLTMERRLGARLTRHEHKEICEERNAELAGKLEKIDAKLEKIVVTQEKQQDNTLLHRQWMGDSIALIRTQIAVIRARMGDDPLQDDTGNFKRGGG